MEEDKRQQQQLGISASTRTYSFIDNDAVTEKQTHQMDVLNPKGDLDYESSLKKHRQGSRDLVVPYPDVEVGNLEFFDC